MMCRSGALEFIAVSFAHESHVSRFKNINSIPRRDMFDELSLLIFIKQLSRGIYNIRRRLVVDRI